LVGRPEEITNSANPVVGYWGIPSTMNPLAFADR
jgi:hypothetical protein